MVKERSEYMMKCGQGTGGGICRLDLSSVTEHYMRCVPRHWAAPFSDESSMGYGHSTHPSHLVLYQVMSSQGILIEMEEVTFDAILNAIVCKTLRLHSPLILRFALRSL
jgi:hypothetical protein